MIAYFKVARSLLEKQLWTSEKFTRGQAWVDLIGLANWKEGFIRVRGIRYTVERGQCGWSQQSLAARWKWSRGKVRRFLDEMESVNNIVQQNNNITSIITIVDYDLYQDKPGSNGTADSTTNDTANGQQTVQQTDTKKLKELKELKELKSKERTTRKKFIKPSLQELTDYIQTREVKINPQSFLDYNDSKGWVVGKAPMKDWQAAVRTWEKRERQGGSGNGTYRQTQQDTALQIALREARRIDDAERASGQDSGEDSGEVPRLAPGTLGIG
jgi:hypothetical protein